MVSIRCLALGLQADTCTSGRTATSLRTGSGMGGGGTAGALGFAQIQMIIRDGWTPYCG